MARELPMSANQLKSWRLLTLYFFSLAYLLGGWFLNGFFKPISTETGQPGVEILVASKPIPDGTYLENPQQFFRKQNLFFGKPPADALSSYKQLKNKYLQGGIRKGEYLTNKQVTDYLRFDVPPGTYPSSVPIKSPPGLKDWQVIGFHFDLLLEVKSGEKIDNEIIFRKKLVIGVDTPCWRFDQSKVYSLALTHEESLKLNLLREAGVFYLARYVSEK